MLGDKGHTPDDDHHHQHQDHGQTFSTWSYETERPLSLEAVCKMAKKLPGNIYRCKGVIYVADAPQRRAVLQVVGRRADIALHDEWRGRKPQTQIVAIGAPGSIDAEALREQFDSCIIEGA